LWRHANRTAEPVFLRSPAPAAFITLWGLLGGLAAIGWLALHWHVPIYVRALALPASSELSACPGSLVILIPAGQSNRAQVGQRVIINTAQSRTTQSARVASIYPGILDRRQIEVLVDHSASAALALVGEKSVALAELDPASNIWHARGSFPGCCEALVEVGSRPVISLFWGKSTG